jgi:hypothetical protein
LKEVGVPDDEIQNLDAAIEKDKAGGKDPSFSGETGQWYTRLLSRATEGGLGIGLDAVTAGVAKLLSNYFGGS